jgi:signal-transduction protein with cAMP-binding, CBS, and nucleotidyltransferase domain/PAS domain-containing protein
MKKYFLKILLPTIVTILLFILTIFFIVIPHVRENIMNGKREMIKELVNSAWSILAKYENDEKAGLISREEAQQTAISRIQYLRYGEDNKDYFWITDMQPVMIMHPYRPDLNGENLDDFEDKQGKKMFVEFVKTVAEYEHGYVDYMWQWKDDSLHIVPKLSYVQSFEPWGWVIGTGIYIEDVKQEIHILTRKLLWFSLGITFIITILLIFISQQSLKEVRKRFKAEAELVEANEKYKTLVDAATEGLIMLFNGKISFVNHIISNMLGYQQYEMLDLSINELLINDNQFSGITSDNMLKEGQYQVSFRKKDNSMIDVLITSSKAMLYGQNVNIVIIKDISIDKSMLLSGSDYQKLMTTLQVGFFRARIDTKGKILYADDIAIRILGYRNFMELSDVHILQLLANNDDKRSLRKELLHNGYIKKKILKVIRKNNEIAYLAVSMVLITNDDSNDIICNGILEDITYNEIKKLQYENTITTLTASQFLIEQPCFDYVSDLVTLHAEKTISDLIHVMKKRNTDCVFISNNPKEYIGIITKNDLQERVIAMELHLDNPVYMIMSAPLLSLADNATISQALQYSNANNIHHIAIKNNRNTIVGVLHIKNIIKHLNKSLSFYITSVEQSLSVNDLIRHYANLQTFIKPLIKNDIAVQYIFQITSALSDSITRKIIELCIEDIGTPPVKFAFICLGSEGRKEETLFTDQDNAIIYEDIDNEKIEDVSEYFLSLGQAVCNSLNKVGYAFCKGNIMASNIKWCQPISKWEQYFISWISSPEPQNLLDASIFFDFRTVYGEQHFENRLRDRIVITSKQFSIFFYHMALNTYNIKIQSSLTETIDLKSILSFISMFVRTYSLKHEIKETNTLLRIQGLQNVRALSDTNISELHYMFQTLMKFRLKNQIRLSEQELPMSNSIYINDLNDFELSILKKIVSKVSTFQNIIGAEFPHIS